MMSKSAKTNFTFDLAKKKLIVLQTVGKQLLDSELDIEGPLDSLKPLGMVLLEGFNLFSILISGSYEKIHNLFDGGEEKGPNIDTRLKFMRDLISASNRATYTRASLTHEAEDLPGVSVVGIDWLESISPHVEQHDESVLTEVLELINETLEALLSIAMMLNTSNLDSVSKEVWREIHRHVVHIRDHYDYAETYIIDMLRPAEEG
jgi:hypothetical protein